MALSRCVLVLRALGLGDLLTAVPALRAIRRAMPDREIVLAAPAIFADLLVAPDLVDRVLPTHGLTSLTRPSPHCDIAVNLHGSGPQSHQLLLDLAPRRLVAFACPALLVNGPDWRPKEHEVRRWCRLVDEAGWPADPSDLYLPRLGDVSAAPGAVVVHPGAAHPARRWPVERFAAVADWARRQGHEVVVTGSADEAGLAHEVARSSGLRPSAVLAGRTSLRGLAALVADAQLVLCGDTGLAHLASAYRTPSVLLFGPVPPAQWGPPPRGPHTVIWHGAGRDAHGGRGDPFGAVVDPALCATTVDEVIDAVRKRLKHQSTPASGALGREAASEAPS